MGINNYLPFATGLGATLVTQVEYQGASWRPPGFPGGAAPPIAEPSQANKIWRQTSVVAAAITQAIVDSTGVDCLDDGDVAGLEAKFIALLSAINPGALAELNLLLNAGMQISQAFGTASSAVTASGVLTLAYTIDQWPLIYKGSFVGACQQVTDAPPGFTNSLKVTISTAQAVIGADDCLIVQQYVEGYRIAPYMFGSAAARSVALSFWVKAHRIGAYTGALANFDGTRSYPFSYAINVSDTWEYKTIAIPGDVAGTWLNDSNYSIILDLAMAAGANMLGSAGAWVVGSTIRAAVGQINGIAAVTDTFQVTGACILPSSSFAPAALSPQLVRTFDRDLKLCQYFYQKYTQPQMQGIQNGSSTAVVLSMPLPVRMRLPPSVVAGLPLLLGQSGGSGVNFTAITGNFSTVDAVQIGGTCGAINTTAAPMVIQDGNAAHFIALIAR